MANIAFTSLGCDKNTVDTEKMLYLLLEASHIIVTEEALADVIIVNTCAFIHDAKEESIQSIIELGQYKQDQCKFLIVTGCLGERYQKEMFDLLPEVDAILGVHSYEKITTIIDRLFAGEKKIIEVDPEIEDRVCDRVITTAGHYEYLKIAEGCNHFCTYCIIPKIRGKYKSRPMEDILKEAKKLGQAGVRELLVIAQDSTSYGIDLYQELKLPKLLSELCEIEEFDWIRLLYCYPENITEELIQVVAKEKKICKYIDIPLQHTSNKILKQMGRRVSKERIFEIVARLRELVPEMIIRTTIIVGFPGETKEDFLELCQDVKELRIDKLGVFTYSKEENTSAYKMKAQVQEAEKQRRKETLMAIQERIVEQKANDWMGKELLVIVDGRLEEDGVYCARSYMDLPNIDGIVFFQTDKAHMTGEFVKVKISEAVGYDLYGKEIAYELTK